MLKGRIVIFVQRVAKVERF
jgi:hypothetical protein